MAIQQLCKRDDGSQWLLEVMRCDIGKAFQFRIGCHQAFDQFFLLGFVLTMTCLQVHSVQGK
ncbi:hypothetical protein WV31_01930 [Magnetospirillum sp. ME-1]|uniref:Uncharacterized protein n=1 Tax=Paramagnetospirillum magneticum (strain ATCC 700264 / AMB-1) TaxID=342108 RepID=Q2W8N1_PARM1|nr:hypothetical protein WV31_01930 [Magnetospirillum sp. ME-1]BAE49794.1 hypothetical protein amb0990 [Paramagnetospirillum magneticum AMB-1]